MSAIADLAARLRSFAAVRGREPLHTPKNLLMALTGEVGELSAELQWLSEQQANPDLWDAGLRRRVTDEGEVDSPRSCAIVNDLSRRAGSL